MNKPRSARLGRVEWFDLTVAAAKEVGSFYEKVVGWKSEPLSMGDYDDYCMQAAEGDVVAGVCHARGSNAGLPPQWMVYINVDNLDDSLAACIREGGTQIGEIRSIPGSGRYCMISDPAGAVCALFEPE